MKFLIKLKNFASSWTGTIVIVLFLILFVVQAFVIPSRSMTNTLLEGDMLFVKKFSYGVPIPRIPWLETPILPDIFGNGHLIPASGPKRGDIVVFIPPHENNTYYVKRNFAVGGDEVVFSIGGFYLRPFEGDEYIKSHYRSEDIVSINGKLFVHNPYMQEHKGIHYGKNNFTYAIMVDLLSQGKMMGLGDDMSASNIGIAMSPIDFDGVVAFYKKIDKDSYFMVGDNRDASEDSRFWGVVPYKNIIGSPWFIYFSLTLPATPDITDDERYVIRWNRMFKTPAVLEKQIKSNE